MKRTTRTAKWLINKRRIDDSRVCVEGEKLSVNLSRGQEHEDLRRT